MKLPTSSVKLIESNIHEVIFEVTSFPFINKSTVEILISLTLIIFSVYYKDATLLIFIPIGILLLESSKIGSYSNRIRITRRWIEFYNFSKEKSKERILLARQIDFTIKSSSNKIVLTIFNKKVVFSDAADFTLFLDHFVKIADLKYDKTISLNNGKEQLIYRK